MKNEDLDVICIIKNDERYVFMFNDSTTDELVKVVDRYVESDELSFSKADRFMVMRKINMQLGTLEVKVSGCTLG